MQAYFGVTCKTTDVKQRHHTEIELVDLIVQGLKFVKEDQCVD